jgi:CelD/BcsL family acetyltransferase involved in cellulose biosynthesis
VRGGAERLTATPLAPICGRRNVCDYLFEHPLEATTPFQTNGWWRGWIREAAPAERAMPVLARAPAADGGTLVAGLQVHRTSTPCTMRPLSWPWADYHDAARVYATGRSSPRPEADAADADAHALAAAIDSVRHDLGAALALEDLVDGGLLHRSAVVLGARTRPGTAVVSLDLNDPDTVSRIIERGEMRRKRRKLEREGTLRLTCAGTPDGILARLPAFVALHRARWAGRADVVAPFDGGVVDRTFAAVATERSSRATLHELCLGDTPIAAYFGFVHRRRYWGYRTAYDTSRRRDSPGHLLLSAMVSAFAAGGVDAFDLMRGSYAYKLGLPSTTGSTITSELPSP